MAGTGLRDLRSVVPAAGTGAFFPWRGRFLSRFFVSSHKSIPVQHPQGPQRVPAARLACSAFHVELDRIGYRPSPLQIGWHPIGGGNHYHLLLTVDDD